VYAVTRLRVRPRPRPDLAGLSIIYKGKMHKRNVFALFVENNIYSLNAVQQSCNDIFHDLTFQTVLCVLILDVDKFVDV
jgi:hypothetical protein